MKGNLWVKKSDALCRILLAVANGKSNRMFKVDENVRNAIKMKFNEYLRSVL